MTVIHIDSHICGAPSPLRGIVHVCAGQVAVGSLSTEDRAKHNNIHLLSDVVE